MQDTGVSLPKVDQHRGRQQNKIVVLECAYYRLISYEHGIDKESFRVRQGIALRSV
jgi:hypothetical protein